jgi:hypothetical protein
LRTGYYGSVLVECGYRLYDYGVGPRYNVVISNEDSGSLLSVVVGAGGSGPGRRGPAVLADEENCLRYPGQDALQQGEGRHRRGHPESRGQRSAKVYQQVIRRGSGDLRGRDHPAGSAVSISVPIQFYVESSEFDPSSLFPLLDSLDYKGIKDDMSTTKEQDGITRFIKKFDEENQIRDE